MNTPNTKQLQRTVLRQVAISFLAIFMVSYFVTFSQLSFASNDSNNRSQTINWSSEIAEQELTIEVYLPASYDQKSQKKYAVLYTVSGGSRLQVLKAQLDWLSHVSMGPMPEVILITLPYIQVETNMHPKNISASGITHEMKTKVLMQEVIKRVEQQYQTLPFRIIEGFSSNANFLLHVLRYQPELFTEYIISAPALVLDQTQLIKAFSEQLDRRRYQGIGVYLALGSFTDNRPLFEVIRRHLQQNNLKITAHDYSEENYLVLPMRHLSSAISSIFNDMSPDVARFTEGGIDEVIRYFNNLELRYGEVQDSSATLIDLAFWYANNDQSEQAVATISHITKQHPDNIFFLTRKALIHTQLAQPNEAKSTWLAAKAKAQAANNEDALAFINEKLTEFTAPQ